MYVNEFDRIFNSDAELDKLLEFAQNHSINSFSFYDLWAVLPSYSNKLKFAEFLRRARADYGVEYFGAVVGSIGSLNNINNFISEFTGLFTSIVSEFDYWNVDPGETRIGNFNEFINLLTNMREKADEHGLLVEAYLSSIEEEDDMDKIVELIDRGFVSNYKDDPEDLYSRFSRRWRLVALAAERLNKTNLDIWPLFSAEFNNYRGQDGHTDYLGPWIVNNNSSFQEVENIFWSDYLEDNVNNANYSSITGFQWFDYTHMFVAVENLPEISRLVPEQQSGNVEVNMGQTITFMTNTFDVDCNLERINWYFDGMKVGENTQISSCEAVGIYYHTFFNEGDFKLWANAFDSYGDQNDSTSSALWNIHVNPSTFVDNIALREPVLWFENPVNQVTDVHYVLPGSGFVNLYILNQYGILQQELFKGHANLGKNIVKWKPLSRDSGIYYLILKMNGEIISTRRALLVNY